VKRNLFIAIMALSSTTSFAAEMNAGKIHFTGQIIEPSCVIDGDSGSTDSTVPLGTYPTSLFTGPGIETDLIPLSITLKDCPLTSAGLPAVQLTFTGSTVLTGSNTLLDVSKITTSGTTAATNVGIALSPEGDNTNHLKFDGSEGQVPIQLSTNTSDKISASFNARYISFRDNVTAGPADADLTVNILYH